MSHLLGVSLLFILPEMVISVKSNDEPRLLTIVIYGKALVYVTAFYINYYLIVPYSIERKHSKLLFFGCNLVLLISAMCTIAALWQWGHIDLPSDIRHIPGGIPPQPLNSIDSAETTRYTMDWVMIWRDSLVLLMTVALAVALKLTGKWKDNERMRHEAQSIQRHNELTSLKAQLNPHFLFNTLNTIYALIDIKPNCARDAVHELSSMLRYALYECHGTVTLDDELRFVDTYIQLVNLRMPNQKCIQSTLTSGNCGSKQMAPLLFINIVENCIKHSSQTSEKEPIKVQITALNGVVTCECSNPYLPSAPINHNGLGLKNLQRRLDLLYGNKASMIIDKSSHRYSVTMKVDISQPPLFSDESKYSDEDINNKMFSTPNIK
ncbi:MAG: histidine kinase [Paramuribaculum sp.]|nr:histidine kinase [Paramuribaculum sp.]